MNINVADWVQGNTRKGELIQGFVEEVDWMQGMVKVHVIASDNEEAIGKPVHMRTNWVKALPVNPIEDRAQLESLIDVALVTRDEEWFMELSGRLDAARQHSEVKDAEPGNGHFHRNRLGLFDIK
jgi:hypothetical protein